MLVAVDTNVFIQAFRGNDPSMIYFLYKLLEECCKLVFPNEAGNLPPAEIRKHFREGNRFWAWWDKMEKARKLVPTEAKAKKVPKISNLSDYDRALADAAKARRCVLFAFKERGFGDARDTLERMGIRVIIHADDPDWIKKMECS